MTREERRKKAIEKVEEAISYLEYSLSELKRGTKLEDLEEGLSFGSIYADSALDTCCDAAHDPECKGGE